MPNFMDELLRLTGQYQDPFKRAAAESPFREADRNMDALWGNNRNDVRPEPSGLIPQRGDVRAKIEQLKKQLYQLRKVRANERAACLKGDKGQCAMADATEDKMKWVEKELEKLEAELEQSKTGEPEEEPFRGAPASASGGRGGGYTPNPRGELPGYSGNTIGGGLLRPGR